jgi:ankyrin repeat protein
MSAPYDTDLTPSTLPIRELRNRAEEVDRSVDTRGALGRAAGRGDTGTVTRLLSAGTPVDALADDGFAALHHAAARGRTSAVAILLARGATADVRSCHPGGCTGATPLMAAVAGSHGEVVRQLLASGASPDERDDAGFTPLHLAAQRGSVDIVKALLLAGATLEPVLGDTTPLDLARRGRHLAVVGLLKQLGAH